MKGVLMNLKGICDTCAVLTFDEDIGRLENEWSGSFVDV